MRFTNIFDAVTNGTTDDVRHFIEKKGIGVNVTNDKGYTPLHFAAGKSSLAIAELLVSKGANVNAKNRIGTPLHVAAHHGNIEVMQFLISNKANINAEDEDFNTPLHYASNASNLAIIELLISSGANVNAKSNLGTPLHVAAMQVGNIEVAKFLISAGADVNAKGANGFTPLDAASQRKIWIWFNTCPRQQKPFSLLPRKEPLKM